MFQFRLGTKVLLLCLGIAFALATTLTALGYSKARGGLREQAESAMAADASGVAEAIDRSNDQRLRVLQALAAAPVLRRGPQAGTAAQPADLAAADAVLAAVAAADPDVDSIGVLDLRGT